MRRPCRSTLLVSSPVSHLAATQAVAAARLLARRTGPGDLIAKVSALAFAPSGAPRSEHLTLKLAGTLGEVTFAHLERSAARQGTLFAPGKCCEIFKQDVDVGSMLKLTVQYGSEAALGGIHVHRSPWNLVQIIVGEGATGSVRVFPASRTLYGNEQLVLTPRLSWFGARPPRL